MMPKYLKLSGHYNLTKLSESVCGLVCFSILFLIKHQVTCGTNGFHLLLNQGRLLYYEKHEKCHWKKNIFQSSFVLRQHTQNAFSLTCEFIDQDSELLFQRQWKDRQWRKVTSPHLLCEILCPQVLFLFSNSLDGQIERSRGR